MSSSLCSQMFIPRLGGQLAATTCMKLATTRPIWNIGTLIGYCMCFSVFPFVLRSMPLGTVQEDAD